MLEVLRQDYVRTARSKGLAEQIVVYRHALRNAFIPVVTLGGLQLVSLLSGTVILESIFSIPGIGQAIVIAATQRDYPVIQSLTMLLVFMMLTLHIIVDIVYGIVDPRIKFA
jgi:peptide/nickel transport system permease protein